MGQRHALAPLYPQERLGTHCIGGWVGPRTGLDRCGKSRPHRDSIPGPSSPWAVATPIELPGPRENTSGWVILALRATTSEFWTVPNKF